MAPGPGRLCLVLAALLTVSTSKRILVVFPTPGRTHSTLGDALVSTLLDGGHNVTYITTSTELKNDQLTVINVTPPGGNNVPDNERPRLSELLQSSLPSTHELTTGAKYAVRALRHEDIQMLMRKKLVTFDVVVAEWFYSGLLAPLAEVFECPLIWYSSVDACWMNLQLVHETPNPAYAVDLLAGTKVSESPSVSERAHRIFRQAYLTAWHYYVTHYIETPLYYEQYQVAIQRRGRTPPPYDQLVYSGSMLLINSHPILGQNLPLPNSAKYIGGHHLDKSQTLPKELQNLFDKAKYGVIYVNLGSTINSELPLETAHQLLKVFRQLEQVIIWRYGEKLEHVPGNVHLVEWAPQLAILSHPKTLLMVSDGGHLSILEALQSGAPLVSVPALGDQQLPAGLAAARGEALLLRYSAHFSYQLKAAIHEVLGNSTYRSNAKKASAILKHQLVPPSQELRYWVELVMAAGSGHLRSPALKLNLIQLYHLDVLGLMFLLYWFFTKVAKLVKVYWDDWGTDVDTEKKEN